MPGYQTNESLQFDVTDHSEDASNLDWS